MEYVVGIANHNYSHHMLANKRKMRKIGNWLGDTGLSSEAMASVALGASPSQVYAPADPSDFTRCVQFLEKCIDPLFPVVLFPVGHSPGRPAF
jgi:hypothetical protein